jgi:hypothetical protein
MIAGVKRPTMPSSKSDYGIRVKDSQEIYAKNLSSPNTIKSMKLLKMSKSSYHQIYSKNNTDEQNIENFDEYCKKLRSQQVKMFSPSDFKANSIYKKLKSNQNEVVEAEKSADNSTFVNQTILLNQEQHFKAQLIDDQMNNDENKLELLVNPKLNQQLAFERSKKWTSMYALRDSFRNLTSCVATRNRFTKRKYVLKYYFYLINQLVRRKQKHFIQI